MRRSVQKFILAPVMMLAMAGTAWAGSDIEGNPAEKDIKRLTGLGVLEGYPDGTFKPENSITRAEFAKIAVKLAGKENAANAMKSSKPNFKDVKANEWYTGWANVAASLGYVKGYPDGTFRPNNNITSAEVTTVLLRVLGYDDRLIGNWPANYLAKAAELGITSRVAFDANVQAKRGDVAIMASETADEYWVEYDRSAGIFVKKTKPGTNTPERLIEKNFQSTIIEDALVVNWEYSGNTWKVQVLDSVDHTSNQAKLKTYSLLDKAVIGGAKDVMGVSDFYTDLYFDPKEAKVSLVDKKNYRRLNKIERDVTQSHLLQATVDAKAMKVFVDGTSYTLNPDAIVKAPGIGTVPISDLKDVVTGNVYGYDRSSDKLTLDAERVRLVFDENDTVAYVKFTNWPQGALVKEVLADRKRIVAKPGANSQPVLPTDLDKGSSYIVELAGTGNVPLSEIKPNDIVFTFEDANGVDYSLLVFRNKVEGTLNGAEFDSNDKVWRVTVDGKKYDVRANLAKLSKDNGETFIAVTKDEIRNVYGKKVKLFLNGTNDVDFIETAIESSSGTADYKNGTIYGIASKLTFDYTGATANVDGIQSVKIMRPDGAEVVYRAGGTTYLHWYDGSKWSTIEADDVVNTSPVLNVLKEGAFVEFDLRDDGTLGNLTVLSSSSTYNGQLQDVDTDLNRVKIDGVYYSVTQWTTIFDTYSLSDPDVVNWSDIKYDLQSKVKQAPLTISYKKTANKADYLAVAAGGEVTAKYGVLVSKGRDDKGYYAEINVRGNVVRYDSGSVRMSTGYENANVRSVVRFETSGLDLDGQFIEVGSENPDTVYNFVYSSKEYRLNNQFAKITRLDTGAKAVEITIAYDEKQGDGSWAAKTASKWYNYDADTQIYDIDNDKDIINYVSNSFIADGDRILIAMSDGELDMMKNSLTEVLFSGFDSYVKNSNVLKWIAVRNP